MRGAGPADRGLRVPGRAGEHPEPAGPDRAAVDLAGHPAGHLGGHGHGRAGRVENNFWQLFVRPAGATRWSLVTPEGVADNGGLVAAAGAGGTSLVVGFRPSQALAFSPLATSGDTGQHWTPGLLDADLADVPDAMAVAPSGQTLALLHGGSIEAAASAGAATAGQWSRLATLSALAASAPGRGCGLVAVNAVSFGPDNVPMAAGSCVRRGVAGVFADTGGTWQAAGPVLPAGFGGDQVQVLGLARTVLANTGSGNAALLVAGTDLLAAWSDGARWTVSRAGRGRGRERVGVRAGRQRLGAAGRGPGGDHRRARGILGGAAGPAGGHRDAGAGAGVRIRRAGRVGLQAHRVAAHRGRLDQGPGDERADPVRLLELGPP